MTAVNKRRIDFMMTLHNLEWSISQIVLYKDGNIIETRENSWKFQNGIDKQYTLENT